MAQIYINHVNPFNRQIQIKQKQCIIITYQISQNKLEECNIISQSLGTGYQALSQTAEKGHEQLNFCTASCPGVKI